MLVPFIRTLILYIVIIAAVRLMGKRQVGEMQPGELVVTILVSAVASVPVQDIDIPLSHGVIPILTLMSAEVIISAFSQRHIRFRRLLSGNPVQVISNGMLLEKEIEKLRLSLDDIMAALRLKGIFDIRDVEMARIETKGQLSIMLKGEKHPATLKDLGIKPPQSGPFYTVISDGHIIASNLKTISKDSQWLEKVIRANGVNDPSQVYFMCADIFGSIVFCKKEGAN